MDAVTLRELVVYEPETGLMRWRHDHKNLSWIKAGDVVGRESLKSGYRCTTIYKKQYYQHRLVWLYVHGEWPTKTIDHINGNRADNRIENLRQATYGENQQNRRKGRDGLMGAYPAHNCNRWYSTIMVNSKSHYLGMFSTEEEAAAAYVEAKAKFHPFAPKVLR